MSYGQVAYETYRAVMIRKSDAASQATEACETWRKAATWDTLPDEVAEAWESAARAARNAP